VDKLKIQKIHKLNTTHKKQATRNTAKQNYPGSVTFTTLGQYTRCGAYSTMLSSPHMARTTKLKIALQLIRCRNTSVIKGAPQNICRAIYLSKISSNQVAKQCTLAKLQWN